MIAPIPARRKPLGIAASGGARTNQRNSWARIPKAGARSAKRNDMRAMRNARSALATPGGGIGYGNLPLARQVPEHSGRAQQFAKGTQQNGDFDVSPGGRVPAPPTQAVWIF
jgi:hypothetical protein